MKELLKKWCIWILVVLFWFGVAVTFIGGFIGTFFKSTDKPQDDYEEYIHSTIP
jgi:hypothetical protein